jgi:tRNA nucleotidyltransferase (CCA-adding enzyme)
MDTNEYLDRILKGQELAEDSQELKDLRQHRKDVEALLRDAFRDCNRSIRYGGSVAKATLIKESYDLDIACYFDCDDESAGSSLKDIYENTAKALAGTYQVERKTSALRLRGNKPEDFGRDFHVDVVPGRFVDESRGDCFLHQEGPDKERLKTNLQVHIDYVRKSEVVPAIRLLKLWKSRRALAVKTFVFELLVIKVLKVKKRVDLSEQLTAVWKTLRDAVEPIQVEDPANPSGNDLSSFLAERWAELSQAAATTLEQIENYGWESVFGPPESDDNGDKASKLRGAAAAVITPSKPWLPGR